MTIKFVPVIVAGMLALGASAAEAAKMPKNAGDCELLLEEVEISVENKKLAEAASQSANDLLLALDKHCAESDYKNAKSAAEQVEALLKKSN